MNSLIILQFFLFKFISLLLFEIFKFYNLSDTVSVCIEMSSHALEQKRLKHISSFNSCSVLNIGTDHLDYHGNIQNYTNAKFKIFDNACAVNLIDFDFYLIACSVLLKL